MTDINFSAEKELQSSDSEKTCKKNKPKYINNCRRFAYSKRFLRPKKKVH